MATRTCPGCGAQYVATVRRCIDCDVVLVDEVRPTDDGDEAVASSSSPVGSGDQIGYELEGWGNQLKVTLEGMLARAGIGRVWEAGALVVAAADEEVVDDLIATLEGGEVAELDDRTPRVALEIEGLDADDQAALDARLIADAVPHAWDDEGALVVAETDEERVLELLDEVLDAADAADDGDGLEAHEALSALYVSVDRLVKDPHDRKLATTYTRAAAGLDGLAVPYGFATTEWDELVAEAAALAARVADHADAPPAALDPADTSTPDEEDPDETDADEAAVVDADADADGAGEVVDDDTEGDSGADALADDTAGADPDAYGAADAADEDEVDPDADDDDEDADEDDDEADPDASPVEQARDAARRLRGRLVDLV